MGLKEKTVTSSAWQVTFAILGQLLRIIISIIMARILTPRDFGLLGMGYAFYYFFSMFLSMGMGAALIQKKDIDDELLSSVFWLNVITGAILGLLYFLCAGLIADFFHEPLVKYIIYVTSTFFIIGSTAIVQNILFQKNMEFKKLSLIEFSGIAVAGAVGITLAANGHGVWSLVMQTMLSYIVVVSLLWVSSRWRPKFVISWEKIKTIFDFSIHSIGTQIVSSMYNPLQNATVGKILGAKSLGVFSYSYNIIEMIHLHFILKIGAVLYPAFSKINMDIYRMKSAFLKSIFVVCVILYPIIIGVMIITPELIDVLLGEKWKNTIPLIQIMLFILLVDPIEDFASRLFLSLGKARIVFKWRLFRVIILIIALFIGLQWKMIGIAIALTAAMYLSLPILLFKVKKIFMIKINDYFYSLRSPIVSSVIMIMTILIFKAFLNSTTFTHPIISLLSSIFIGIISYTISLRIIFKKEYDEIWSLIKENLISRKGNHIQNNK